MACESATLTAPSAALRSILSSALCRATVARAHPAMSASQRAYFAATNASTSLFSAPFATIAPIHCTGLKPLRYFALKIDRQQPVLHVSALHFDILGELEAHRCRGR